MNLYFHSSQYFFQAIRFTEMTFYCKNLMNDTRICWLITGRKDVLINMDIFIVVYP